MDTKNIILIVIVSIIVIALLIFLIRRNREDIKVMNPDAADSVQETETDLNRKKDSL